MEQGFEKVILNVGCGLNMLPDAINIDLYGEPDVRWDLNIKPWPFEDNRFHHIQAFHVFEHLTNWWGAFEECSRVLKPNGTMEVRVPHCSSSLSLGYRDHVNVINMYSFHGIDGYAQGTNAWAVSTKETVPMRLIDGMVMFYPKYNWMRFMPKFIKKFCIEHLCNFAWEQRMSFQSTKKINART
jgi:SAM-dependent methyltransferase